MGSKGSKAPAPDPRLADAQIRSMNFQDDAIKRMLATSEELAPLQKQQLQFGLDSARTAYNQSQEDRTWSLGRRAALTTAQDQIAKDAADFNTGERTQTMLGEANADVDSAFSNVRDQGIRGLARLGVTPGSGRASAMSGQMDIAQAMAKASAAAKVRSAARAEGFALNDRVANSLAGYPALSMNATGAGAGYGASGLSIANSGLGGLNAGAGQAAGVAGSMGGNATGMFGAQAQREASMQRPSWLGEVGALAGGAAKLYTSFKP